MLELLEVKAISVQLVFGLLYKLALSGLTLKSHNEKDDRSDNHNWRPADCLSSLPGIHRDKC